MPSKLKEKLKITMEDNTHTQVTLFCSKESSSPIVICMPAMGVPAKYYEPLALNLVERGFNVITADLRGIGFSSIRASRAIDFGYHEMVTYDWPAIIDEAKSRFPGSPVFLSGHSLGGQLNALYAGKNAGHVDGLILISTGSIYYRGWAFPKNMGVLLGTQFTRLISKVWGYLPGKQLGFGGREARTVIRDWAHSALTGRYEIVSNSHDFEASLKKMETRVLVISLDGDQLAPQQSVKNLYNKMEEAEILHLHLGEDVMDRRGLNHFKWVQHSRPIAAKIEEWFHSLQL